MTDLPDTPTDRPKFPYLKKGAGIRRFRGPPPKRLSTSSLTVGNPHPNEADTRRTASASSLPYPQTPKRPTTATTTDSGLPEDQLPSTESLTQHDENDDVFVDDEVAVTMSSATQVNQNQPTNESMMAFQPNYYSTPIAKDVDACEARLNLFAPNSVRDAMKLMEEVATASTSSESLTSLQQIKTPSVTQNPTSHDERDAVDAPEEVNRQSDPSTNATVTTQEKPAPSTPNVPPLFNRHHSLSSNITMPRASDYKVSIPTNFNFKRFETPLLPASTSTRSSFPWSFATPKHHEDKFMRSHSIEVDKSEFTPVKMVRFKSKPTLAVMPSHDVSLLSTPIFPKPLSGCSFEIEVMAELMRHQMMSFDNVVDGIAKRYAKLDSIRESKLHKVQRTNKECQKQVEDLKTRLRMSQNIEKGAKDEIAKLKKQLEAAGREIEEQKLKNAQVSKTLAAKRLECQNQKEELARVTAEKDKFKQDLQKSNSLYSTLENNLREERRTNYLLNRMAKENIVQERPKPVPPPSTNKRPDSQGRNPFGQVGQIRGPLGSASSTDSSNVGGPVKQKPVVVAVQRAVQEQPSKSHKDVEVINEDYLMEYVPEDAVMGSENWDGIREVRVYKTPNMHYLWSRIDACGCETLLVNNHDYHQYCAFGTPVHIFMAPFTESNRAITITVDNIRINSFPSKQLELHRLDSSDKTIIKDSNERYEYFYSAESNAPIIEVFNGTTGRRQNRDGTMTNIDGTGQTGFRADGSYCIVENEKMTFKHQWFDLSRSTKEHFGGGFRLAVYESTSDRYLQVSVCPEHSVVIVKHVEKVNGQDQKELCTGHRSVCQHLK